MRKPEGLPDQLHDLCGAEKEPLPPGAAYYDFSVSGPAILSVADQRDYGYRMGHVITRHGVVGFYDQRPIASLSSTPHTSLDVVANGRSYRASWPRTFSDRFLKTLATRYAAKVAREHSSPRQVLPPIREESKP